MKKFLLLTFLMSFSLGFSQGAAPTPPVRVATDVISVFSGAYSDIAGTDFYPNWGQGTQYAQVPLGGDTAIRYTNLDYQGNQFSVPINALTPAMTHLHIDVWTPNIASLEVFLIAGGENSFVLNPTFSGWNSYDIPLTHYSNAGRTLNNIIQFKFAKTGFAYQAENNTVYIDNLYFWKPASGIGTPNLSAFSIPTQSLGVSPFVISPPTSNSSGTFTYSSSNTNVATILGDVITVVGAGTTTITATQAAFGSFTTGTITTVFEVTPPAAPSPSIGGANAIRIYTDELLSQPAATVDTYRTGWSQGDLTSVVLGGSNTLKYTNMNFVGMETIANPIDASAMNLFHIDIWTPNMTVFRVKLVDLGVNGVYGGGDDVEHEITITPTQNGWNSLNFLLSSFTNLTTKAHIGQLIISGSPPGAGVVYVDNMYFSDEVISVAPILTNFSIPAKQVGDSSFTITPPTSASTGSFSYTSSNESVATISGNQITIVGEGSSTITATQAAAGNFLSASITAVFLVTVPPATAAPTPPVRNPADVISLFSNAYANISGIDWFPYWGQTTQYQELQIQGDDVKRYYNFNYEGVQFSTNLNVQSMTTLHIDVWTTNCTTLRIYPIPGGAASFVDLNLTFLGWNSFDIPLSSFNLTPNELNGTNGINQFKFESTPFGAGNVYIDNVYFWRPSSTVNLKLFVEGYYAGAGTMTTVVDNQAGLPPTSTDVESVIVELHNASSPYSVVASASAMLKTDGSAIANFPTAPNGSFYIAVKTKNAIETWTKDPQSVGPITPLNYDFTTAASQAYGDNMVDMGGVFGFYSGDINDGISQDGNIDSSDYSIWETDNNNFAFGIFTTDLNGDGNVDASDYSIWESNNNNFIFANFPTP